MTEVYLTSSVIGGFGNQLFIIAAGFHMKNLVSVKLIFVRNPGQGSRPTYWNDFFSDCPLVLETLVESLPQPEWKTIGYAKFSSEFTDRSRLIEENRQKNISTINEGYFQNLKYLPSQSYVRELFNITQKQDKMKIMMSDIDLDTTCTLHFRLGDYKGLTHIFPLLPDSYYKNAVAIVKHYRPQVKTLLVFNELEDQESVEERMKYISMGSNCEIKYISQYYMRDWQEVIIMSLCRGIIIANSTFSWWGAYFANPDSTVVYPLHWHRDQGEPPEHALAVPTWIKCSSERV